MIQSFKQRLARIGRAMKANKVSVSLPFGLGGFEIVPNKAEQRAAWALYVELTTRVASQQFNAESGLMREVLTSLYSLFSLTRQILRDSGPDVAYGPNSFGPLAIDILTKGIAPFTTKWHQKLKIHESNNLNNLTALEHERSWEQFDQMRKELEGLQKDMRRYADILSEIAGAKGVTRNQEKL